MSPPRWLILGAGGMLGRAWREALASRAGGGDIPPVRALDRAACDITDANAVRDSIAAGTGVVINCAAYTDVDGAEKDEARAAELNGAAVECVADRCAEVGATLVHYSTDYVFDGAASRPYAVDHPRAPINAYGRSKALGEEALERSGADFLCVRTSWLYAPWGRNFVTTITRLCRERDSLRVVDDQIGRPSSAQELVHTTVRLLESGARGFRHGCDAGECSWFQFAQAIAARVNPACDVAPCRSEEFPRPAARPAYSVLDLTRTTDAIGPIPSWRTALQRVLDQMGAASGGVSR